MKIKSILLLFIAGLNACTLHAQDANAQQPSIEDIVSFLKQNVINRTVLRHNSTKISDGRIEAVFERSLTGTGLLHSDSRVQFDLLAVIKQTNYDLNDKGERVGDGRPQNRTIVARFILSRRASTGEVTGFSHFVSSSVVDGSLDGFFSTIRVKMDGWGRLTLVESTALYVDGYAPMGKYEPIAVETAWEFSVEDGKLRVREDSQSYDVDIVTLKRTKSGEPRSAISTEGNDKPN